MYKMKIHKEDGVQYRDPSSKVSDIMDKTCTDPQKFERDDDTERYTFTGNNECSAKSHNECSDYAKDLGEFESDAVHESEPPEDAVQRGSAPGCAVTRRRMKSR